MVNIILIVVALLVLCISGLLLAKSINKDHNSKKDEQIDISEHIFNTKYDEITYLYKSGAIKEQEYKAQMKNIIN